MSNVLTDLQAPESYCASRPQLFPGQQSFRWFVRKHRAELIEAGALTLPHGRWLIQPEAFDQVVLSVGARRAAAR